MKKRKTNYCFSKEQLLKWSKDRKYNPKTGRVISKNGCVYNELKKQYKRYLFRLNANENEDDTVKEKIKIFKEIKKNALNTEDPFTYDKFEMLSVEELRDIVKLKTSYGKYYCFIKKSLAKYITTSLQQYKYPTNPYTREKIDKNIIIQVLGYDKKSIILPILYNLD